MCGWGFLSKRFPQDKYCVLSFVNCASKFLLSSSLFTALKNQFTIYLDMHFLISNTYEYSTRCHFAIFTHEHYIHEQTLHMVSNGLDIYLCTRIYNFPSSFAFFVYFLIDQFFNQFFQLVLVRRSTSSNSNSDNIG